MTIDFNLGTSKLDTGLVGATVIRDIDFLHVFCPGTLEVPVSAATAGSFLSSSVPSDVTFHTGETASGDIILGYKKSPAENDVTWFSGSPVGSVHDVTSNLVLRVYSSGVGCVLAVGDNHFDASGMIIATNGHSVPWRPSADGGHVCIARGASSAFSFARVDKDGALTRGDSAQEDVHTFVGDKLGRVRLSLVANPAPKLRELLFVSKLVDVIYKNAHSIDPAITRDDIQASLDTDGTQFLLDGQVADARTKLESLGVLCTNEDRLVLPIDVTNGSSTTSFKVVFVSPGL